MKHPNNEPRSSCCRHIPFFLCLLLATNSLAQATNEYRSIGPGFWHLASTWQRYNGTDWVAAATYPDAANSPGITVRSPHIVTLNNTVGAITMDDLVIEAGATLTNAAGCHVFNDGAAPVDVSILGTYNGNSTCGSIGCCGTVHVGSGGLIALNGPSGSAVTFTPLIIQAGGALTSSTYFRAANVMVNHGTMTLLSYLDEVYGLTNNGTIIVSGAVNIQNGAGTAHLTNNGTLTVTNGNINLNSLNAAFNNNGTLNVNGTSAGQFTNNAAGGQSWNNNASGIININNSALKGIGCCVPFNNAGTFNLNAGQVNQSTVFNHTGTLNVAAGATFNHFAAGSNSGTYTIAAGGTLMGSMTNFTGASITNNGNITVTNLPFAGTTAQTLTGSGAINTLTISNASGVTLGGTQTINANLTLTNGKITLGNNNLLMSTGATLTGGTAANYVVTNGAGALRRRVPNNATNVFYPVGLASSFLPVNVQLTAGSTADDVRVRVEPGVSSSYDLAGIPNGTPLTAHSTQAVWHINEGVPGGSNASVQVQWNLGEEGTGFARGSSTVMRYNGSTWDLGTFAAASGSDPYTRSRSGITSFSPFGVSDNVDTDGDGTFDFVDQCPLDAAKITPGVCGCGIADVAATYYADTDGDGFGAGAAIPGFTCAPPANTVTNNTDGCADDPLKQAPGVCGCGVADTDTDLDGLADCVDDCPTLPGEQGDACDADPGPGITPGAINGACTCVPTVGCTENVTVELRTDALSSQASWQILAQNTNDVLCQFTVPVDGITTPLTENCCLPAGCYRLRVLDSGGDGFVTGGYQLRESGVNGRRIIDNLGNFSTGSLSAISSTHDNGAFCVPIGNDRPIFASCDKQDWVNNQFIVATENAAVTTEFGVTNTTSGYEFWFFDPNGSYSYRRFRNHATSDGFGSGATRACHFKINGWINNLLNPHIPANTLMNVRIRGRVAGNNLPFGPACLFKIDATRAACPIVKLQDNPLNVTDYSCGVNKTFGGGASSSNRITANPPQFQPPPLAGGTALRYQFRFRIPGELPSPGSCIVRPAQTSATLNMNWTTGDKLKCNTIYEVDVRVSKDGGATWCVDSPSPACSGVGYTPWGKICTVNIGASTFCPGPLQGGASSMSVENTGNLTMYPNPNRGDLLFVSLTSVDSKVNTVTVDLFDMTGKRVMARTIAAQDGMVNTNVDLAGELAGGVYLVNITAGDKTYTERLVIQP